MDLKTKADQRRVATGAKASSGRAHQQTPTRTDIQAPEGRKRPMPRGGPLTETEVKMRADAMKNTTEDSK